MFMHQILRFRHSLWLALAVSLTSAAHFQELIPSTELVTDAGSSMLTLDLAFTHPMERGPVMPMGQPVQFGVLTPHGRQDLRASLIPRLESGQAAYRASYPLQQPGDHVFFIEPAPYWEPAEGVMIVHYTKVVVDGFSGGGGWDASVGFPVEIQPLTRPYGLWTGNLFRGLVLRNGQPVPFAEVEVEWRNDGSLTAPADAFVTQVIKTDAQGVFAYAMPRAGWWGFAALLDGEQPMTNPAGVAVPVELGAVMWVRTREMR
ncbi:cobalt/nickel transport protein [Allochromatium warmingii]|uniref:Cobalt/nickel transport protein n=1 Tax=Allochromatium warmingii TaxID=61595 RepID=A0A1H3DCM2_ALLWA|nr:cobalt/nickel transport protein [Allochromatium warmingii]